MRLLPALAVLLLAIALGALCARCGADLADTWHEAVEARFDEMETRDE